MKKFVTIMMFTLLVASVANVHAEATSDPQGGEGPPQIEDGAGGEPPLAPLDPQPLQQPNDVDLPEPEAGVDPSSTVPPEGSGGALQDFEQQDITVVDFTRPSVEHPLPQYGGTQQQDGVDYCAGQQKIVIAATNEMSAREVFEDVLRAEFESFALKKVLCFEFEKPIILDKTLEIHLPYVDMRSEVILVGMDFVATPEVSPHFHGNVRAPLIHVESRGGTLKIIDLDASCYSTERPIKAALHIENSEDVVVQRGSFRDCEIGIIISNSSRVHIGADAYQFVRFDGSYIGKNARYGIFVERGSDRTTFGYNKFDSNVNVVSFDYDNAVFLGHGANDAITPAALITEYEEAEDDSANEEECEGMAFYMSLQFSNPPGSVQVYSIWNDEVNFVGACDLGEDHKCCVKTDPYWLCKPGMKYTAIYTSSALEASSAFMVPTDCSFHAVITPPAEFIQTTPAPEAEDSHDVTAQRMSGEADGGAGAAPKMMCNLSAHAGASYSPLLWLFLSTGFLGIVRFRRRK